MENKENFEVILRLFGTEVLGFKLASESSRKMWIVMGTIVVLIITSAIGQLTPLIQLLM